MNVGRLVMPALRWSGATGFAHEESRITASLEAGVGGFIVFGGPAPEMAKLSDLVRERAGYRLLLAADLERGAGQQFAGLEEWPPPRALAALHDAQVIAAAGRRTAEDARSVGIDWVFAPD